MGMSAGCQHPMWPEGTDWSKLTRATVAAWVAQWPLCGVPLSTEQAVRAMPYCNQHQAEWSEARTALAQKDIVVVFTSPDDRVAK